MSPFLSARQIVKRFPNVLANDQVDFDVQQGEIHGLLGENGAGKSTLMQIIYGQYGLDSGEILIDGFPVQIDNTRDAIALGIGMIHQEFMLVRRFSVVENVVMGLGKERGPLLNLKAAASRLTELSKQHGLQVDPAQIVERLPVGVQQRVEILKLLYRDVRLLILDEPTAVLTEHETEGLFAVLRQLAAAGHSIVIVTHKLQEIMAISDRVTIMRDGRVVASVKTAESSQSELARLMVGRDVALRASRTPGNFGKTLLRVENLHVADHLGAKTINGIDLTVREGEILGLAGVDGNGQGELAAAIMNLRAIDQGRVLLADADLTHASPAEHHRHGLAYVPADRRHVGSLTDMPIHRNAILGRQCAFANGVGFLNESRIDSFASALIKRFDIRPNKSSYLAETLSGGNLQKLVLGREVMRDPRVMIIEQPTRGLDVGAIEAVWREIIALRDSGKAILLISAELEEILNLADRVAIIYEGRIMGVLDVETASIGAIGLMMAGIPLSTATEGRTQ